MGFKDLTLKPFLWVLIPVFLIISLLFWKSFSNHDSSSTVEDSATQNLIQNEPLPEMINKPLPEADDWENPLIQEQLDLERKQQKHTKELKIKLEQTNLELDEEKAEAQINKLKKENLEAFNEPSVSGQSNFPQIRIDYIGGNEDKKEAIISINGISYQIKSNSFPMDNIRVLSISESSVTLHFSVPQDLTKTFDFKPE